jgi:hypothetical protein
MKTFRLIVHRPKTDLKRGSYNRNRERRPTTYEKFTKPFRQKKIHFEAAFVCRIFLVHTMSFQKASKFSKIMRLPRSWLCRFIKSIPELPEIFTGKRTANKEITLVALIPKTAVFVTRT